jgi:N-acetylmuramoyl-L-alanine amidase
LTLRRELVYVAGSMRPAPVRLSVRPFAAALAVALGPAAARGQLRPSAHPAPLPPIPLVEGPLALTIVYPPADGPPLGARDSTFLYGSTGSGRATLVIDGTRVEVAPDGAFLAWLPLPDDSLAVFHLAARLNGRSDSLDWPVRLRRRFVPPPARAWLDPRSLTPRGNLWTTEGEAIRVAVRAAPGASVSVRLPDGRIFPLAAETTGADAYGPFERRPGRVAPPPVARYGGVVPAVPLGAPLPPLTAAGTAPQPGGGFAVAALVVAAGADTIQTALPLRVSLLDPQRPTVVVLDDDPARTDTTQGAVVGAPTPQGTYHWFFLDGTRAAVDGRIGDQVRVRLSAESVAWVPLAGVAATLPAGTPPPATRVRLVRLSPEGPSVSARFALDERVPFRVDEDERGLTVRFYGAQSDLDFVQYGGSDSLVRRVTWAQPTSDEVTVSLELSAPVFGWRKRWEGSDLVLEIRRPPVIDPVHPLAGRIIAVDPGHPPEGATGPTGLREADANLAIGLALRDLLQREGARVVMTRTADTALGLYQRVHIAERADAEILVSIHNNALPDGVNPFVNQGTSVYYFHARDARLAMLTEQALVGELGLRDLGAGRGNLALVRPTWMPAILTEGAFLMIPEQESALRTPGFQHAYARGVALGIQSYLRELGAPP